MKKLGLALILPLLLSACASLGPPPTGAELLQDRLFQPPKQAIEPQTALALSEPIRAWIDADFRQLHAERDPLGWMMQALQREGGLRLRYDTGYTRTASEAYAQRAGNCLSLALLTGAIAREIGLPVYYQAVFVPDTWSRSGDLNIGSSHVNVAIGARERVGSRLPDRESAPVVIDFLPPDELRGQRSRVIGEATVLAMYLNNRAAEHLAAGDYDEAYAAVGAAIRQDPTFLSAYNTLGVLYLRHGNAREAEQALRYALAREPENTAAMGNLVRVLQQRGAKDEAAHLQRQLAELEPFPPYHFFDLGIAAMQRADYPEAARLFRRELRRAAYQHEFHFWLALAELGLGEPEKAKRQLGLALENSTTQRERTLYAAKLDWLRQQVH